MDAHEGEPVALVVVAGGALVFLLGVLAEPAPDSGRAAAERRLGIAVTILEIYSEKYIF